MFDLGLLPTPWNAIALLLLAGTGLLLIAGFAAHPYDTPRQGRMPKRTELPQSFLLIILAAVIWLAAAQGTALATLGLLTCLGMVFGFLGDLFMANVFRQEAHVLFGMVAFAVGHIFYMLGFRQIALAFDLHAAGSYGLALVVMWAAAAVLWYVMVRKPGGDAMQYAALVYALFLASMAGYALGIALQQPAFWPLAIGGGLFLFSDALIAANLFSGRRFRYMGDLIWLTYILAQALIVTTALAALALL